MSFSTISFIFIFLPITFLIYGLAALTGNIKYKNFVLLISSVVFYGWCGLQYLFLLAAIIVINFLMSRKIEKSISKKYWLLGVISVNVIVLGIFKYFNFFAYNIENMVRFIGKENYSFGIPLIPLPLGISFFTFQIISYVVDVYRGEEVEKNFINFALYVMFFPQLVEGPIIRYRDISETLHSRISTYNSLEYGTRRFMVGFAKKVLIADKLLPISNAMFEMTETGIPTGYAWLGIISYSFVIYFDFSGYSDMAIGLSEMFGFHIAENFDYPYISQTVQEFWRRWHITLSSWFRDYVYIPLGGNRNGVLNTYRNLMIVFLLTGLWHGASWTFVIWGVFHGVFMLLERGGLKTILAKLPNFVRHLYTLFVVVIGWVFFRAENINQAIAYIRAMFIPENISYAQIDILRYINREFVVVLLLAVIFSTPVMRRVHKKFENRQIIWMENTCIFIVFIIAISTMLSSSFSPSIYTKF